MAKITLFSEHTTLNCGGKLISFQRPLVMGILNITPDSFHDGGKYADSTKAIQHAKQMLDEGADIIDIGAVSTRPGASVITEEEEKKRLMPVIEGILKDTPEAVLSVDTFRASIARASIAAGASIINDISGGSLDNRMFETIAALNVPYVLMHMQGTPETMQLNPKYKNVTRDVIRWLADRVSELKKLGVNDIIIDPGFGFGKTGIHNFTLMNQLEYFRIFELPLLVGISRKSMVYKTLNIKSNDSLTGTIALNYQALINGANILRVHDVKEAIQTIRIFEQVQNPDTEN